MTEEVREPRRAAYERIGRNVLKLIESGEDVLIDEGMRKTLFYAPNSYSRVALVDSMLLARVNAGTGGAAQ